MSSRSQLLSGIGWNTLTVVLQVVIQMVYTGMLARLIAPESFILMGVVLSIMGFAEIFSQIGIGPALIQRKEVHQQHVNGAFYTSVILGVCFTLLFVALAPAIAAWEKLPQLEPIIQVVCTSFTISALSVVPRSMMMKEMQFKAFFKASMVSIIGGNLVVGLSLAWLGYNVWAYVWALFAQNALMAISYWVMHPVKVTLSWKWQYTRELLRYGTGSTLFNALNYAATKVDLVVLPRFMQGVQGITQQTLEWQGSMYERANYVMSLPITIMAKLSDNVLFSGMAKMQDEEERLRKTVVIATNLLSIIIVPATVFIIFFSPEIIGIWLGPKYFEVVPILQVLIGAVIWRTLSRLGDSLLRAKDAVFHGSWIKGVYLVLMVAGILFSVNYGMTWVAASIVITTFVHYLMSLHLCRRLIGVTWAQQLSALLPSITLGIIAALACGAVRIAISSASYELAPLVVLILGATVTMAAVALAIFTFPAIMGHQSINPLSFLPSKLANLSAVQRMVRKLKKTN